VLTDRSAGSVSSCWQELNPKGILSLAEGHNPFGIGKRHAGLWVMACTKEGEPLVNAREEHYARGWGVLAHPIASWLSAIFTNGALRNTRPTNASAARRVALEKQARD